MISWKGPFSLSCAITAAFPACSFYVAVTWLLILLPPSHLSVFVHPYSDPASHHGCRAQLFRQLWLQLRGRQHGGPHEDQIPQSQPTEGQAPQPPQPQPQPQPFGQPGSGQSEGSKWYRRQRLCNSKERLRRPSSRGQQRSGACCWGGEGAGAVRSNGVWRLSLLFCISSTVYLFSVVEIYNFWCHSFQE